MTAHNPTAIAALHKAVDLVGLDANRVPLGEATLTLDTVHQGRAVLRVAVLLEADETAAVLAVLNGPPVLPCVRAVGRTCPLHNVDHWRER